MNVTDNISRLTSIPLRYIEKIFSLEQDYICYAIQQAFCEKQNNVDIDIGIGTLSILVENENVYYKFLPSQSLENDIQHTVSINEAPMIKKLEENIKDKVLNAYKELL